MTESEKIGELYVEVSAIADKFKSDMAKLRSDVDKEGKKIEEKLSFKAKFDTSVANFRISELRKPREKLQKEFDKKISIDVSSTSLDRTREKLAAVDARLKGVGDTALTSGKSMMNAFAWVGGIAGTFTILKNMISAARESAVVHAQIYRAVETTGQAAGYTAKQLFKLADELKDLTAIDDDTILKDITNNLLTFKNVSGDAFKRAQLAILDLNAVISKGEVGALTSQTIQLGKALNAPTEGVTALTRVGVSFTEQQKEQIKTLEQSGKLIEAQSIILEEIEGKYGGQAKVLAEMDGGYKKFNQTIDDISESIGNDLVGSATEGTGALQELATGFLELNDAVKEVNSGVGIFGTIIDGLKNVVTGGRGIVDTAFNIKGQYKAAKEKYIKDMQEAKEKTESFYDAIGYSDKKDLTPKVFSPILDTTAGDEVLKQYDEQQTKIDQIKNKLKDVNLTTEQRLALEKELASNKDKGGNKSNTVTTTFKSQIPQGYTADQLVEFEKLKYAIIGYVDFRKAQIEEAYKYELSRAQGNASAVLQAEENKNISLAKLNSELTDFQKASNDKLLKDTEAYLKEDEEIRKQNQEKIKQQEADYNQQKLDAIDGYYDGLRTKNEDYFNYKVQKIQEESDALLLATGNSVIAKQFELDQLKELEQEYFEWKLNAWREDAGLMADITIGTFDAMTSAYDTFWQTLADADMTGKERMEAMWQAVKVSILQTVGNLVAGLIQKWIMAAAVGDGLKAAEVTAAGITGPAIAAAYAPAATFASVMSFGGAAVAGEAALATAVATSQMLAIPKFGSGTDGYVNVPEGFSKDNYPIMLKTGEDFNVRTPAQRSKDKITMDGIIASLNILNENLLNKNLSPTIVNNLSIDGKSLVKQVTKITNEMLKAGKDLSTP